MSRYLLDTNAVGDFLNHRHGIPERVQDARSRGIVIGTCEPVVAELFFGVENSASRPDASWGKSIFWLRPSPFRSVIALSYQTTMTLNQFRS